MKNKLILLFRLVILGSLIVPFTLGYAFDAPNREDVIVDIGNSTSEPIFARSEVGDVSNTSIDNINVLYTVDNPAGLAISPANPAEFKKAKIEHLRITGLEYGTFTISVSELHSVFATDTSTHPNPFVIKYKVVVHVIPHSSFLNYPGQGVGGSAFVSGVVASFNQNIFNSDVIAHYFYTTRAVYIWDDKSTHNILDFGPKGWTYIVYLAPPPRQIVNVRAKGTDMVESGLFGPVHWTSWDLVILLDDGTIVLKPIIQRIDKGDHTRDEVTLKPNGKSQPSEVFKKLCGDDLYSISDKGVYRFRNDSAAVWELDTAGLSLNNSAAADIDIDSAQNVYTAIGKTVFTQALKENTWHSVSQLPANVNVLFVDRRNRLFVGTGGTAGKNGVYRSNDLGKTWQLGNGGIGDIGIYALGDDAYGNIYAVTDSGDGTGSFGGRIYRSKDGGINWTRIDQPIRSQFNDHTISHFFNAVSGDSLLFAATILGVFASSDQGDTWQLAPNAVASENVFGLLKLGNATLVSNLQGIFRTTDNDTMWHKTYPVNGFINGNPLSSDNNGNAYMLRYPTEPNQTKGITLKSMDGGLTWAEDTTGLYKIGATDSWFVDELGNQHVPLYVKPSGGSWQVDVSAVLAFLQGAGGFYSMSSDGHGWIYLTAGKTYPKEIGYMIRRPIGGGVWQYDTTGLSGAVIMSMAHDRSGNMFGISYSGKIYMRSGSAWKQVTSPLPAKMLGSSISADSTGAIMATGWYFASNFGQISNGVWVSKDQGKNWRKAGLDSIFISGLVSYGDSTFCLSDGGIYVIHSTFKPVMQIVAPSIDFGNVLLPKSRDTTFQIANLGTDTLFVSDVFLSNPVFTVSTKSYVIPPDAWVTDTIHFTPTSAITYNGTIGALANGKVTRDTFLVQGAGITQGGGVRSIAEDGYVLEQNNPNPFKTSTTILYKIPNHEHVRLTLLDPLGKQLAILFEGEADSGEHDLIISAHDLASGVYVVRMEAGGVTKTQMICVVK